MGFIQFSRLVEAQAAIHHAAAQAIKKAAFDVEARAKMAAAVDTGFMKSSVYSELHDSSTYGQAIEPPAGAELLPEIPRAENDTTAYVAVGASYAVYVETGTVHMAAQPFLGPAADAVQASLTQVLSKLEDQMRGLGF